MNNKGNNDINKKVNNKVNNKENNKMINVVYSMQSRTLFRLIEYQNRGGK